MSFGKAFHHLGPTAVIGLSATLVLVLGMIKRISLDGLLKYVMSLNTFEHRSQIHRRCSLDNTKERYQYFEHNSNSYWQPVLSDFK